MDSTDYQGKGFGERLDQLRSLGGGHQGRETPEIPGAGPDVPISRALVGDEIADRLSYPESTKFRARDMLLQYRLDQWPKRFLSRVLRRSDSTIDTVLGVSFYDDAGVPFHLPDHMYSEQSSKW